MLSRTPSGRLKKSSRFSTLVNKLAAGNLGDIQFIKATIRTAFENYNLPLRDEDSSFIHPHYRKMRDLQKLSLAPPEEMKKRFQFHGYPNEQLDKDNYHRKEKLKQHPDDCSCDTCKAERGEVVHTNPLVAPLQHKDSESQDKEPYGLSIATVVDIHTKTALLNEGSDEFSIITPVLMEILNAAGPKLTPDKFEEILTAIASSDADAGRTLNDPAEVQKLMEGSELMMGLQKLFNHKNFTPTVFINNLKKALQNLSSHQEGEEDEAQPENTAPGGEDKAPVVAEGGNQPTEPVTSIPGKII